MDLEKTENKFDLSFEVIHEQFQTSMNALVFQDYNKSEKSFIIARNTYLNIEKDKTNLDDLAFLGVFVRYIEVITLLLKSTFLTLEERFEKAYELTQDAISASNEARGNLRSLKEIKYNFHEYEGLFSFMFSYFELILSGALLTMAKLMKKTESLSMK